MRGSGEVDGPVHLLRVSAADPGEDHRGRAEGGAARDGHARQQLLPHPGDRQLQQERPQGHADQLRQPVLSLQNMIVFNILY